jgi:hypothetical protein
MPESMKRRIILLVAAAIALAGCAPDRTKDLAACGTNADRFYQRYKSKGVDDPRSQFIIGCMTAKGYQFDISPANCDSRYPLASQPTCYAPESWLNVIVDRLRSDLSQ